MNEFRVSHFIFLSTRDLRHLATASGEKCGLTQKVLGAGIIGVLLSGCSFFQTPGAPPLPDPLGHAAGVDAVEHRAGSEARAELLTRVESLETSGEYSKALSSLEEFLRDHPTFGEGLTERAERLRSMLRHLAAAQAHREAGRALDAAQELDKAVAIYPDLAHKHPEYSDLREQLLELLEADAADAFESHDDKKLLEVYAKIREERPLDSQEWLRSGQAHENLGDVEKARECYASILEQAREYAAARSRLARIAHSDGDLKQARAELERAHGAAPENIPIAIHYAKICVLLGDLDTAVGAWKEVGMLQPGNPDPFEIIGRIEEKRRRWEEAGIAYRECIQRTNEPRRVLLLKFARAYGRVGKTEQILEVYLNILERAPGRPVPSLGDDLRKEMLEKLRDLGYVRRQGEWIAKKHVFPERGWIHISGDLWVRPEEARLREVAGRIEEAQDGDLRTLDDANYTAAASTKSILKGMNRREMVEAWGFFEDQNVFHIGKGDVVYEQLLFSNGRQIYLRNGLVCFWSN